ncbi:Filamin-B [Sarcoptes scabiei]|nr:Filamin-B [Sarcoptes scabiei]
MFENRKYREKNWLEKLKQSWSVLKDSQKIFIGIAILNGLCFICWRIPRFHPFMCRNFLTNVSTNSIPLLPMILSNFSHHSLTHLVMNMIVLYSFCDLAVRLFGRENFLALYLSSGVISSLSGCLYKVISNISSPSLGASGAILGILGATCLEKPDISLMIVFFPFFTFSSYTALKSILLFDALGLILRWHFFDHAAHIGGTLSGV